MRRREVSLSTTLEGGMYVIIWSMTNLCTNNFLLKTMKDTNRIEPETH